MSRTSRRTVGNDAAVEREQAVEGNAADLSQVVGLLLDCALPLAREIRRSYEGHTLTQCAVIATVEHHGTIMLSDLARIEGLSLPTASRVVQGSVEQGLLDRSQHESDRRVYLIALTTKGRRWARQGRARQLSSLIKQLKMLGPEELAALKQSLPALALLLQPELSSIATTETNRGA